MVTSKLNKLIFILVLYIFTTSCRDYQKECDCKTIIGLEHNVKLNSNELNNNFKGLKIQHIRNGRIIENISFENQHVVNAKRTIKMNRTKDLYRTDSIKFTSIFRFKYITVNIEDFAILKQKFYAICSV